MPEHEWTKVRKKPVEVHYRKVEPHELGIVTLEGFKECNLRDHYIIMGIAGEQYPIKKCIFHQTYTTKSSLGARYWTFLYIAFGLYGTLGEILIGTIFSLLNHPLWLYYNGFYTSLESFFLFGFFGILGFKLYRILMSRRNQR